MEASARIIISEIIDNSLGEFKAWRTNPTKTILEMTYGNVSRTEYNKWHEIQSEGEIVNSLFQIH